jgi:hypothetical protein
LSDRERHNKALVAWLSIFLKEFRSRLVQVPEEKKPIVLKLNDFREPCLILVFWVLEPAYQYVLVVRDPIIHNDVVKVYGPASLATMSSEAEKMLKDDWFEGIAEPDKSNLDLRYKTVVEQRLLEVVGRLSESAAQIPPLARNQINIVKRAAEGEPHFTWSIFGSLVNQHPLELATKTVADPISQYEEIEKQNASKKGDTAPLGPVEPEPTEPGFVSAFYPPIWLGDPLTFGFRERLDGVYLPPRSKVFRSDYKGRPLTIMRNGLLIMIERDQATCLRLLNEIMCTATFLGIPSYAVRDTDLAEATFYKNGDRASYSFPLSEHRRQSVGKEYGTISEAEFSIYKQVTETDLQRLLEIAASSTKELDRSNYAIWYIDARTYFEESNFEQAATKSWLVLEKHIRELHGSFERDTLGGKVNTQGGRLRILSMERVLLDLREARRISEQDYKNMDRLRILRNSQLHDGRRPMKEEAEEFLKSAEILTREKMLILPDRPKEPLQS